MIRLTSYVCGEWHTGTGEPRLLYDPTTEQPIAECDSTGIDFAAVVAHARDLGVPGLQELGFAARGALLKQLSATIHEHRDALIELSAKNGGSTRKDAKFDLDGATGTLAAYAALGKQLGDGNCLPDGEGIQLGRTPRYWAQHILVPRTGVAVLINAFNFPAWGMCEKLACSILAGVPAIAKPGTPSAQIAWEVARIIVDSGTLPSGAFQFIAGSTGDLLEHLGAQDCMSFTGSSWTGAKLKGTANLIAKNVRVNIEADSLNAAILGPDVGTDDETYTLFLNNITTDMTQKTGQKCTAVRRVLVPQSLVDDVVRDLKDRLEGITVGDPAEEATNMGPLASQRQLDDVRKGIERLATACEVVCGGADPMHETGYFVAPTLLVAADANAAVVHTDEVFGPCATVLPYSGTAEDATALANRGGGSLVASVYSNDRAWTQDVVLGISPWHGRVWIGSDKVVDHAFPPGAVLPYTTHGGPGRAGGGEELGGLRGLGFYMQRTAVQGYQGLVARSFGAPAAE